MSDGTDLNGHLEIQYTTFYGILRVTAAGFIHAFKNTGHTMSKHVIPELSTSLHRESMHFSGSEQSHTLLTVE